MNYGKDAIFSWSYKTQNLFFTNLPQLSHLWLIFASLLFWQIISSRAQTKSCKNYGRWSITVYCYVLKLFNFINHFHELLITEDPWQPWPIFEVTEKMRKIVQKEDRLHYYKITSLSFTCDRKRKYEISSIKVDEKLLC